MKALVWLAFIGGIAYGAYWYWFKPACGSRNAVACPAPELEEGLGTALRRSEVCPRAGYLCSDGGFAQVTRWPLDKGRLRIRVPLPEFAQGEEAERLRAAAIEGIMAWDGHPFPLLIDKGKFTVHMWDVRVVWTQGLFNEAAGLARPGWMPDGKRVKFFLEGLAVVVPPATPAAAFVAQGMPPEVAAAIQRQLEAQGAVEAGRARDPEAEMLARVKAVASHEMGHALGLLMHSDSESDIMFPTLSRNPARLRVSPRDLQTVDALYTLPNGAILQ
jgi:hypothetical protein